MVTLLDIINGGSTSPAIEIVAQIVIFFEHLSTAYSILSLFILNGTITFLDRLSCQSLDEASSRFNINSVGILLT